MAQESPETVTERAKEFLALFNGDFSAAVAALRANQGAPDHDHTQPRNYVPQGKVIINVENLNKTYKVHKERINALKNVSVQIHEGEFVAFTGPSGSGKSTLLQTIGGLDKPDSGTITINDQNITKLSDSKLSTFRNKTIGFVFQFFYLQPFLRLQTNIEVPGMFAGTKRKDRKAAAVEIANAVGLNDRLSHLPKELSGGQMQRAAIARALLNKPSILLADEPTGNLDSANGAAIIDLFEQVRKQYGTTVIVVTHDPKIAARADREITLKDGEILS